MIFLMSTETEPSGLLMNDHLLVFVDFTWNGNLDSVVSLNFCLLLLRSYFGTFVAAIFWNAFFSDGQLLCGTCGRFPQCRKMAAASILPSVLRAGGNGLLRRCQRFVQFSSCFAI